MILFSFFFNFSHFRLVDSSELKVKGPQTSPYILYFLFFFETFYL